MTEVKKIDVDGVEVEFRPGDRYRMTISFERLPRGGDTEDAGGDKGGYASGDLDYGSFVGAQGLVVNLLDEMQGWGVQMAKVAGVIVPDTSGKGQK